LTDDSRTSSNYHNLLKKQHYFVTYEIRGIISSPCINGLGPNRKQAYIGRFVPWKGINTAAWEKEGKIRKATGPPFRCAMGAQGGGREPMALFGLKEIRDRGRYSLSGLFFCLQRETFSPPTSDFPFGIQPHLDNSLREVLPKVTSLMS
jgi:hypothetical protein